MTNLLAQVQQCGDQLFDFQDSAVLDDLIEIGITPKRNESDSTPYILYFDGSLFQLNKNLGYLLLNFFGMVDSTFFLLMILCRIWGFVMLPLLRLMNLILL